MHWDTGDQASDSEVDDINSTPQLQDGGHAASGGDCGGGNRCYSCVVEYKTKGDRSGGFCTKRIECQHVIVTVGLGVLKVRGRYARTASDPVFPRLLSLSVNE